MKYLALIGAMLIPSVSFSHDEGHGPKVTDSAKQGGVVSPVIDAKDAKKGAHAHLVYKSELVRTGDGKVRVYLYDKQMNALDLTKFDKKARAVLEVEKKKKFIKTPFELSLEDGVFVGTAPKPSSKPFNIDVVVKEGSKELLTAFDNLD